MGLIISGKHRNRLYFLQKQSNKSLMLKPSLVLSAYKKKGQFEKRKISFRATSMKWLALLLGCLVVFGSQYCFDTPSALQTQIEENYVHKEGKPLSQSQFNWLYAIYSFPNILIPLIGGLTIDRFGARVILVITAFICVAGQAVYTVGGYENIFWLMLVGRGIFGIGGETLMASQNTLLSNWFKPSELSFVLGICISFPKLGSSLNSYINPKIGEHYAPEAEQGIYKNVYIPLLIALGVMVAAWLISIALAYMDWESDKREKRHHESLLLAQKPSRVSRKLPKIQKNSENRTEEEDVRIQQTQENILNEPQQTQHAQHISLSDITKLPITFWLLILICMLSQALFIPFLDNGNKYFATIYDIKESEAGNFLILPYCFCALICPFLGILVDKIGKRGYVIVFSCLMFAITYGSMIYLEYQTYQKGTNQYYIIALPLILLGLCCALFCTAIVPSVPMIVQPRLFGTAFGLMQVLQNVALATFPLIAGVIRDNYENLKQGFQKQTQFYFLISLITLGTSVVLLFTDRCTTNKFNPQDFRKQYVKTILQKEQEEPY